jgi:hypothetical protein
MSNNICATYEDVGQGIQLVITRQSESEGRFWGTVFEYGVATQISGHGGFHFYSGNGLNQRGMTEFVFSAGNENWRLTSQHEAYQPDFSSLHGYRAEISGYTPSKEVNLTRK